CGTIKFKSTRDPYLLEAIASQDPLTRANAQFKLSVYKGYASLFPTSEGTDDGALTPIARKMACTFAIQTITRVDGDEDEENPYALDCPEMEPACGASLEGE